MSLYHTKASFDINEAIQSENGKFRSLSFFVNFWRKRENFHRRTTLFAFLLRITFISLFVGIKLCVDKMDNERDREMANK